MRDLERFKPESLSTLHRSARWATKGTVITALALGLSLTAACAGPQRDLSTQTPVVPAAEAAASPSSVAISPLICKEGVVQMPKDALDENDKIRLRQKALQNFKAGNLEGTRCLEEVKPQPGTEVKNKSISFKKVPTQEVFMVTETSKDNELLTIYAVVIPENITSAIPAERTEEEAKEYASGYINMPEDAVLKRRISVDTLGGPEVKSWYGTSPSQKSTIEIKDSGNISVEVAP